MAGPILDAIRQFRSNRQERVANRRERVGEYLGSERRIPKLLRSLGAGSSRQDLFWARKDVARPADRKMQDDPAGPDTGKFANQRPYDGDAQGAKAVSTKVVPVIPEDETETIKTPAPVQGGTNTLPEPPKPVQPPKAAPASTPAAPVSQKKKGPPAQPHDDAIERNIAQMERLAAQPGMDPMVAQRFLQDAIIARASQNRAHADWNDQYLATPSGQSEAIASLADASPDTSALLFPTLSAGQNADGTARYPRVPSELIHRDDFVQKAIPTFRQYGGWAEIPDEMKHPFLVKARAAFPPMEFYAADGKTIDPNNLRFRSKDALHTVYAQMNTAMNPDGDPELDKFLRNVAYGVIRNAGGEITDADKAYVADFLMGGPIKRNPPYWFWEQPTVPMQQSLPTKSQIQSSGG